MITEIKSDEPISIDGILTSVEVEKQKSYNQALEDALDVVEWDGYTLDIKERIERLKK